MICYNQREAAHAFLEQRTHLRKFRSAGKDVRTFCRIAIPDVHKAADAKIKHGVLIRRNEFFLGKRWKTGCNKGHGVSLPAFFVSLEHERVVGVKLRILFAFIDRFLDFLGIAGEISIEIVFLDPAFFDCVTLGAPVVDDGLTVVVDNRFAIQRDIADLALVHRQSNQLAVQKIQENVAVLPVFIEDAVHLFADAHLLILLFKKSTSLGFGSGEHPRRAC